MNENYEDIINLPHHVSKKHTPMSMWNRAAQFAPFAALNGHSRTLMETEKQHERNYEDHKTSSSSFSFQDEDDENFIL